MFNCLGAGEGKQRAMSTERWWREIRRLPIEHMFETTPQGEVHSVQCLVMPGGWLPSGFEVQEVHLRALGPFYFERLPVLARGLIRVQEGEDETRFNLALAGWTLLHFGSPEVTREEGGGVACYPIIGGFMLQPHDAAGGHLCVSMHRQSEGLRLCMEIKGYYSRIMGRGTVRRLRRWAYTYTQAAAHHFIARDFVRRVALALRTGRFAGDDRH